MSYFAGCFKSEPDICARLDKIIAAISPRPFRTDPLRIGKSPYLTVFGHRKSIKHLVVNDKRSDSWLAIIGTPLFRLKSESEEQAFLAGFFANPRASLREVIDGHFALFAYDARADRMIAAADLNCTTPIFYSSSPAGIAFASHELALARLRDAPVDTLGFAQAIHLGVTWGARTRFREVAKLLPGQLISVDGRGGQHIEQYWNPSDENQWAGTLDDHVRQWGTLLRDSVWNFFDCANRQPVICDFTGGEDARLLVAQCHALEIPFKAHVKGAADEVDRRVAVDAARAAKFDVITRERRQITREQLLANAMTICLQNDAYLEYFSACTDYATDTTSPLDDYGRVKYGGVPGGEAFRGSYYLRGKALFPSAKVSLDYRFFTRMKYLLDYHTGLLRYSDAQFVGSIHDTVAGELRDVAEFPVGIQIDHLLRVFQTCCVGLMYKDPLYLPLATNRMTRSIYSLPPHVKRGGRLTRACTEHLFPELARVKTQNGVPTIRRTFRRLPLFVPEYAALAKTVANGAVSRFVKWKKPAAWQYSNTYTEGVATTLLNEPPYRSWFESSSTMITGDMYQPGSVEGLLAHARSGTCRHTATLARVLGQELAMRWVRSDLADVEC